MRKYTRNWTFDHCLNKIIKDIQKRKNVDYEDKNSVRRYNAAMDRIIANVEYIDIHYPEHIQKFIKLMHHPDPEVSLICATMVICRVSCHLEIKREAIRVVRKLYEDNKLDKTSSLTIPISLKRWEKKYKIQGDSSPVPLPD